jgi:3-phenylpropionate/trans-cinnamate dioxygenase ferredoxin reductase component
VAVGAVPAVDWLRDSGVPLLDSPPRRGGSGAGGVRCDVTGFATAGVWAAGDVAAWFSPLDQRYVRVEHRFSATEQGRAVARELAHRPPRDPFTAPYFWSRQFDVELECYGLPARRLRCRVVAGSLAQRRFLAAYLDDADRVVAVVGSGMPAALRGWRAAVAERRPLAHALDGPPPAPPVPNTTRGAR